MYHLGLPASIKTPLTMKRLDELKKLWSRLSENEKRCYGFEFTNFIVKCEKGTCNK